MDHLTENQLNEYLDNALSGTELGSIEKHLSGCPGCRVRMDALQSLFQELADLPEIALQHNLDPVVLSRLPDQKLRLGWKLVLATQSGITIGLVILVFSHLLAFFDLKTLAAIFTIKFPPIEIPAFHPSSFTFPAFTIQPSTANLLFLGVSALVLWAVGNATLLRGSNKAKS